MRKNLCSLFNLDRCAAVGDLPRPGIGGRVYVDVHRDECPQPPPHTLRLH
jgi:hypothetical protein